MNRSPLLKIRPGLTPPFFLLNPPPLPLTYPIFFYSTCLPGYPFHLLRILCLHRFLQCISHLKSCILFRKPVSQPSLPLSRSLLGTCPARSGVGVMPFASRLEPTLGCSFLSPSTFCVLRSSSLLDAPFPPIWWTPLSLVRLPSMVRRSSHDNRCSSFFPAFPQTNKVCVQHLPPFC